MMTNTAWRRVDDEEDLPEALRQGQPSACERLVEAYGPRGYRLAFGITRNAADAEEAVQDAFVSVVRKIDTFRGESAFGSWFYRIVVNAAYQKLRNRPDRHTEIAIDDVLPVFHEDGRHAATIVDWSAGVDDPARQAELRLRLGAALDALPAHYRAVLILHDAEGRSNVEIARMLSLSVASVKSRVHRARLFIRHRLSDRPNADATATR